MSPTSLSTEIFKPPNLTIAAQLLPAAFELYMLMLEPNIRILLLLTALLLTAILANHTILYIFLMNENLLRMTSLHCKASGTSS
ncbi:hypothetical protein BDV41DRAFT_534927 [Aspergillus transmontanensis]|uniref:Uncharacterized protein n=1 Tax=Aspergillus transmontanensis TaxID=1034304 RepID=A0A5N6W294_9EURO|nr:hypothetical protein BDV41DRAFT_534927 [Aspergillus transmontanensis]